MTDDVSAQMKLGVLMVMIASFVSIALSVQILCTKILIQDNDKVTGAVGVTEGVLLNDITKGQEISGPVLCNVLITSIDRISEVNMTTTSTTKIYSLANKSDESGILKLMTVYSDNSFTVTKEQDKKRSGMYIINITLVNE